MDIDLDANATTPVLAAARAAALAAMADDHGNPSSTHGAGLRARALRERVRDCARRVLGAPRGDLLFVSGATEAIHTAVLSALVALRRRGAGGAPRLCLLYGATEHKAVPEALRHWNALLGLDLELKAIPVGRDGRHDLDWLRDEAPRAGLVCTQAANNETGVVSDLAGIAAALAGSPALWLVDGVQALGKLPLRLADWPIDYAAFSGHKLYAPKGIGLLYVREAAPFTPLLTGGGQEGERRAGTENMPGIAAFGAVLAALEDGGTFQPPAARADHRDRLAGALRAAFPGLVFNAPPALCLPTTLNVSVPGLSAQALLDVFDAARVRVSGGSACSAARALPSEVLVAMGLPAWQAAAAVRLSFGPATEAATVDAACRRIRACGEALRENGLLPGPGGDCRVAASPPRITRFGTGAACSHLLADPASRCCIAIDPHPGLHAETAAWLHRHGGTLAAVLQTRPGDGAAELRAAMALPGRVDAHGWPVGVDRLALGDRHLTRFELAEATAFLLHDARGVRCAFVGDRPLPAADDARLGAAIGPRTLRLAGRDDPAAPDAAPGLDAAAVAALLRAHPSLRLVDVREPCEQRLGHAPALGGPVRRQAVPLAALAEALPDWLALPADTPVVFFCRSGKRSAGAASTLRRLGHASAWSLAGGLALWPAPGTADAAARG